MSEPQEKPYETTVWPSRRFIFVGLGFIAFMAFIFAIVAALTVSWSHETWPTLQPIKSPGENPGWQTDQPQLQLNATADLTQLRKVEELRLHTFARCKDDPNYARIPIEEAIQLLAHPPSDPSLPPLLTQPIPMSPLDLQNQKSRETLPPPIKQ